MQRGQGGLERPCLYQHRRIQGSECWCFFFPKQKQYMFAKNAKKSFLAYLHQLPGLETPILSLLAAFLGARLSGGATTRMVVYLRRLARLPQTNGDRAGSILRLVTANERCPPAQQSRLFTDRLLISISIGFEQHRAPVIHVPNLNQHRALRAVAVGWRCARA